MLTKCDETAAHLTYDHRGLSSSARI